MSSIGDFFKMFSDTIHLYATHCFKPGIIIFLIIRLILLVTAGLLQTTIGEPLNNFSPKVCIKQMSMLPLY